MKDIFSRRDQQRRELRRKLCQLYASQIDASNNNDIYRFEETQAAILNLRKCLLECDPGESSEHFFDSSNKKRPRLPA